MSGSSGIPPGGNSSFNSGSPQGGGGGNGGNIFIQGFQTLIQYLYNIQQTLSNMLTALNSITTAIINGGGGGGGGFTITDGITTVPGTTDLAVTGGTVGGSTPNATLLITGSGVTVTDGPHTVIGSTDIMFSGATVSGSTPNAIVSISGGGGFTITDGPHTVPGTTYLTVIGGTISGSTPNATLSVSGGGGGNPFIFPGVFTNTQMNLGLEGLVNGLNPTTFYHLTHPGNYVTNAVIGGIIVPSTSTVYEADAVIGYISTASTTTAGVGGSFYALNEAAGTVSYGLNSLVSDQGFVSTVVGVEFDIGCQNVSSAAYGSNMIGVFTAGTPTTAIAYQVSVLNSPWGYSFVSYDGCTNNFALIGSLSTAANSDGQPIQLNVRDASNTVRIAGIQAMHAASGCNLVFTTPSGATEINGPLLGVGAATFQSTLSASSTLSVTGAATLGSSLNVSGAATLGSLSVTGATTLNGTATAVGNLFVDLGLEVSGLGGFKAAISVIGTGGVLAGFYSPGPTSVGSITYSGGVTSYNTTSDARLKLNEGKIETSGEMIDQLEPRWFSWKDNCSSGKMPGFFAQEVNEVFPWAVTEGKGEPGEEDFSPWQMSNAALMPLLVAELKSLRERVSILERSI